jgi:hypothetical protein
MTTVIHIIHFNMVQILAKRQQKPIAILAIWINHNLIYSVTNSSL